MINRRQQIDNELTDDYQNAATWITSGAIDPNDNTDPGHSYIGSPSAQTTETETHICQQNVSSTSEANEAKTKDKSLDNCLNPSIKISLKRKVPSKNAEEIYFKQLRLIKPTEGIQEVTNQRDPLINSMEIHEDNSNQARYMQERSDTVPVGHGPCQSCPPQTVLLSSVQTTINPHTQCYNPTDKICQNYGKQNIEAGQSTYLNRDAQYIYHNTTNNNINQTVKNSPNRFYQSPEHPHQKRISVVSNEYLFQNHGKQEVENERFINVNRNSERTCVHTANTQSVMQAFTKSPYQTYQSSDRTYQRRIPVVPKYHMLQDHGKRKVDVESFTATNGHEQKSNPYTRNSPSAAQALKILMNRRDDPPYAINEKQPLTTKKEKKLYQSPIGQQTIGTSNGVFHQIIYPENVTKTNDCQQTLTKHSQQSHTKESLPPHLDFSRTFQQCQSAEELHPNEDTSGYNVHVHINKIVVARSNDTEYNDQIGSPQSVIESNSSTEQNTANFVPEPSQLPKKSQKDQEDPSGYKVIVQQDSLLNKIIITRSTGMEGNNEIAPPQNNTLCAGKNSSKTLKHRQLSNKLHENKLTTSTGYSQLNSDAPKKVVRTTTTGIPYIVNDYFPENIKNASPVMEHSSKLENQSCQFSKRSIGLCSTVPQNLSDHVPRAERTVAGKTAAVDRIIQKSRLQSIRKNRSVGMQNLPSLSEKRLGQFSEQLQEMQSLPISNDHLLQKHSIEVQDVRQPTNMTNMSHHGHRVHFQNTPKKASPAMQNLPNSTNSSFQVPVHEKHFAPEYNYYLYQDSRVQDHFIRPTKLNTVNQKVQTMPQNANGIQNVSNYANNSCCACKCSNTKQMGPVIPGHPYENLQHTLIGRSTKGYYTEQIGNPQQGNTENEHLTSQSSFDTVNQSIPISANPIQECYILDLVDPLAEKTCSQEISASSYTNEDCGGQSSRSENNTEDKHYFSQKSPNMPNQSLEHPSDQGIRSEEIYVEETYNNETNNDNCMKQSSRSENITETCLTGQDVDNAINIRAISEQAIINDLKTIIRKMDDSLCKTYTLIDNANKIFVEYAESFQKTMKLVNDYYELKINKATASSPINAKKPQYKQNQKKSLDKCRDGDQDDNNLNNN